MAVNVEKRVENLKDVLARFISSTNMMLVRMEADTANLKDEMKGFKDRVDNFVAGVERFKEEMQEFRKGTERDREEYRQMLRDYNRRLGEIANCLTKPSAFSILSNCHY